MSILRCPAFFTGQSSCLVARAACSHLHRGPASSDLHVFSHVFFFPLLPLSFFLSIFSCGVRAAAAADGYGLNASLFPLQKGPRDCESLTGLGQPTLRNASPHGTVAAFTTAAAILPAAAGGEGQSSHGQNLIWLGRHNIPNPNP